MAICFASTQRPLNRGFDQVQRCSHEEGRLSVNVDFVDQLEAEETETVAAHNKAVQSLLGGIRGSELSFPDAFVDGWLPLRRSGQAARVKTRDLEQVLSSTLSADAESRMRYEDEIRELALWVAGESDGRILADWAWSSLATGVEGRQRVVDVWDRIARGDHLALRTVPEAPDHAFHPVSHEGTGSGKRRMPPLFFAAYVVARTLLQDFSLAAAPTAFAACLPHFVHAAAPALAPLLSRPELSKRIASLSNLLPSEDTAVDPVDVASVVVSVLRQVALAQKYYSLPDRPGEGLAREISALFVRGQQSQAQELWRDVQAAVDDPQLAWLDCSEWTKSGRRSLLDGEDAEVSPTASSGPPAEAAPAPPSADISGDPAGGGSALLPARFTQQIVARFLTGFVQAQSMDQANLIWSWLVAHDPPLQPGVACWTGLLRGYAARGNISSVDAVFADMQKTAGLEPDYFAWMDRIEAYFEAKQPEEAMPIAREMMRDRAVLRDLERAGTPGRFPVRMWNRLQNGLLATGRVNEAEALLQEMERAGAAPNITTVNAFLKHHTRGSRPDLGGVSRVLKLVADKGLAADVYTFTMLLQALLAVGQRDASAKTIEIMQAAGIMPTATTYGALINALASTGELEHLRAATRLLDEMESKRMQTNEIVYTSLMQGYLRAGETDAASEVDPNSGLPKSIAAALTLKDRMERRGIVVPRAAYNILLSTALAQQTDAGKDLAIRLFREMKQHRAILSRKTDAGAGGAGTGLAGTGLDEKSVTVADTWYILLDGFSRMNDGAMAGAILREMEQSGFVPRSRALLRLIHRVQKGWEM
ncbi:hypothetical protein JCM8202v2_005108 [Rhodotorula sphaerocarpa]